MQNRLHRSRQAAKEDPESAALSPVPASCDECGAVKTLAFGRPRQHSTEGLQSYIAPFSGWHSQPLARRLRTFPLKRTHMKTLALLVAVAVPLSGLIVLMLFC